MEQTEVVKIKKPDDLNVIIGQSHFIKTIEDIYEALIGAVPGIKFGAAFCEASGKCLVRFCGNDPELEKLAQDNAAAIGCGHSFVVFVKNAFPINILNQIQAVPEVCRIFCATANPLEVVVFKTAQGRAVIGVVDGSAPKGVEGPEDIRERKDLLRKFGYKL